MLGQITDAVGKKENEAAKFGDRAILQILTKYQAREIVSLASPDYKAEFDSSEFQVSLDKYKKALGAFLSGKGSASPVQIQSADGKATLKMEYVNLATFEKGDARVNMELVMIEDVWKINRFGLEPR